MNLNFSKPVCLRLCNLFIIAMGIIAGVWYLLDPERPLAILFLGSAGIVLFLAALITGMILFFPLFVEALLKNIRERKGKYHETYLRKNMNQSNSPKES